MVGVSGSTNYLIIVGAGGYNNSNGAEAHGGDSFFGTGAAARAQGGRTKTGNAGDDNVPGGDGGAAGSSNGTLKFSGGTGGCGEDSDPDGGGGGGAAGPNGVGNRGIRAPGTDGTCGTNGSGISAGGLLLSGTNVAGNGGNGGDNGGTGANGSGYGSGGGGSSAQSGSSRSGGNGIAGIVAVYWSRIDNISTACAGQTITITGFNFSTTMGNASAVTTSSVTLNGVPLTFTVNSNTQITATIPVGGTSGDIIVTTTLGRARYYITVDASSIAPTTVSGGGSYCYGNYVTLTANGATLGTNASYRWYTGSCGGTLIATTTVPTYSFTASTAGTTTYFVRVEGDCNTTTCASTTVTLPTATGFLSVDNESASCIVNGTGWVHFRNAISGRLLVAIDAQGQNLGSVNATSYVQTPSITADACLAVHQTEVLGRRWVITPGAQPLNPVRVRLYFDNSEYSALNPVANGNINPEDNTSSYADLHLSKYRNDGSPLVNNNPNDNCGSGTTTIWVPQGGGTISSVFPAFDANGIYTEYTISDFSEFWLHGSTNLSPLAVTLTSFSATCDNGFNKIEWETESESNSSHFIVERSRDGLKWDEVAVVDGAGMSSKKNKYKTTDTSGGDTYYRLRQVDFDGTQEILETRYLQCSLSKDELIVFPNPALKQFTVEIHSMTKKEATLQLFDLTGKLILSKEVSIKKGVNSIYFDEQTALQKGVYMVAVSGLKPVRLVVQ